MQLRADRIAATLAVSFPNAAVRVVDESHLHAGHAGAQPHGETHYQVALVWEGFAGVGRVARSRAVHTALANEFESGLHALALRLRTPAEEAAG